MCLIPSVIIRFCQLLTLVHYWDSLLEFPSSGSVLRRKPARRGWSSRGRFLAWASPRPWPWPLPLPRIFLPLLPTRSWPATWFWALAAAISKADGSLRGFLGRPRRRVRTGGWIRAQGSTGCSSSSGFHHQWGWRTSRRIGWSGSQKLSWILCLQGNLRVFVQTLVHSVKTVVALTLFAWVAIKSKAYSLI